jgi:hypothetical protein
MENNPFACTDERMEVLVQTDAHLTGFYKLVYQVLFLYTAFLDTFNVLSCMCCIFQTLKLVRKDVIFRTYEYLSLVRRGNYFWYQCIHYTKCFQWLIRLYPAVIPYLQLKIRGFFTWIKEVEGFITWRACWLYLASEVIGRFNSDLILLHKYEYLRQSVLSYYLEKTIYLNKPGNIF